MTPLNYNNQKCQVWMRINNFKHTLPGNSNYPHHAVVNYTRSRPPLLLHLHLHVFCSLPLEFSQPFCVADLPPPAYSSYWVPAPSDSFTVSGLLHPASVNRRQKKKKKTDCCEDNGDRLSLSKLGPSIPVTGMKEGQGEAARTSAGIHSTPVRQMGKRCWEVDGWKRQTSLILIPSLQAEANADIAGD